jgi:hypothetical protein
MIECPACRIGFGPRFRYCPRCGAYEAPAGERAAYLDRVAETEFDRGATAAQVVEVLVGEGVSRNEAAEMAAAAARAVARAERRYGLARVAGGAGLLFLAAVLLGVGLCAGPSRGKVYLLTAGVVAAGSGAAPFALGLYSVWTGRDRRPAAGLDGRTREGGTSAG